MTIPFLGIDDTTSHEQSWLERGGFCYDPRTEVTHGVAMSSIASSSIVFAVVFGGALLGMFLRRLLPQNHLSDESKGIVMIAMG